MQFLQRLLGGTIFVLFSSMILLVSIQVLNRYGTGFSIPWTEEATRTAYVLLIFIGSALAVSQNNHVRVLSVVSLLPQRWRKPLAVFVASGSALFCGFVAYGMYIYMNVNLDAGFPTMPWLSIGWVMGVVMVAALLAVLLFLRQAFRAEGLEDAAEGGQ